MVFDGAPKQDTRPLSHNIASPKVWSIGRVFAKVPVPSVAFPVALDVSTLEGLT